MAYGKIEWKISSVTLEKIEAFLAKPNHAVVGVNRTDGALSSQLPGTSGMARPFFLNEEGSCQVLEPEAKPIHFAARQ